PDKPLPKPSRRHRGVVLGQTKHRAGMHPEDGTNLGGREVDRFSHDARRASMVWISSARWTISESKPESWRPSALELRTGAAGSTPLGNSRHVFHARAIPRCAAVLARAPSAPWTGRCPLDQSRDHDLDRQCDPGLRVSWLRATTPETATLPINAERV